MELLLIPFLFLADQLAKDKATANYQGKTYLWNKKIILGLVYNKGAFLGLFSKNPVLLWVFTGISLVILFVIGIPIFLTKGVHMMKLGVTFIAGGAVGNLYDRYKKGKVTDFFAFWIKPNVYFNLADMFVFLGTILVAIGSLFDKGE